MTAGMKNNSAKSAGSRRFEVATCSRSSSRAMFLESVGRRFPVEQEGGRWEVVYLEESCPIQSCFYYFLALNVVLTTSHINSEPTYAPNRVWNQERNNHKRFFRHSQFMVYMYSLHLSHILREVTISHK